MTWWVGVGMLKSSDNTGIILGGTILDQILLTSKSNFILLGPSLVTRWLTKK